MKMDEEKGKKKKILSKWKWIERECETLCYMGSARLAGQIENALKELYGDTMTKNKIALGATQNRATRGGVTVFAIRLLAREDSFCIACERTPVDLGCSHCLFKRDYGGCGTRSPLYGKFFRTLYHESGLISGKGK